LGTSRNYVILAKSGVTNVPISIVTGDIGVSPIDGTAITGFTLSTHSSNRYATSAQVTGKIYAADGAVPTPLILTTAITDMESAYTDAASRTPTAINLGNGAIGGMNLAPGVYAWTVDLLITSDLTLTGGPCAVFILQMKRDCLVAAKVRIILAGGVQAANIFWQAEGTLELGESAHLEVRTPS
jgi:hypothetical protein